MLRSRFECMLSMPLPSGRCERKRTYSQRDSPFSLLPPLLPPAIANASTFASLPLAIANASTFSLLPLAMASVAIAIAIIGACVIVRKELIDYLHDRHKRGGRALSNPRLLNQMTPYDVAHLHAYTVKRCIRFQWIPPWIPNPPSQPRGHLSWAVAKRTRPCTTVLPRGLSCSWRRTSRVPPSCMRRWGRWAWGTS